jgi:hypothetical protein
LRHVSIYIYFDIINSYSEALDDSAIVIPKFDILFYAEFVVVVFLINLMLFLFALF